MSDLICPSCGSGDLQIRYRRTHTSGHRRCRKCLNCGANVYTFQPLEKVSNFRLSSDHLPRNQIAISESSSMMPASNSPDTELRE